MPVEPLQERVDVWEPPRIRLVAVREQVRPAGEVTDESATVPVKPLTGAAVIVAVPVAPAFTFTEVGAEATVKSAGAVKTKVAVAE